MTYPATFTLEEQEHIARWRPLVQWILVIPHIIVLYLLGIFAWVLSVVAWFAIVITGGMPEGIANMLCMVLRYQTKVHAYSGFLHGDYPPFDFDGVADEPGGDPVAVGFEPELEDRSRLTVFFRIIWAIPAMLFLGLVSIAAGVVWFIAFFAVLFTARWPEGLLKFVVGFTRMSLRFSAYVFLLTDEYPPFTLD